MAGHVGTEWASEVRGKAVRNRAESARPLTLRLLYLVYERRLLRRLRARPMPRHIGIVLDGNRRHAQRQGLADWHEVYALGARKLDEILRWAEELRLAAVTLWVFSTDNRSRPPEQVSGILAAVEGKMAALAGDPWVRRRRIRIRAIGRLELLPDRTVGVLRAAEEATAAHEGMALTIAIGYGGREEIVDAVRAVMAEAAERGSTLAELAQRLGHDDIARHLYTTGLPDPDLIIRTSGEIRLSGFLLWQSVHSEFYFADVPWPAFRKIDFLRAIRSYQQRARRFGR